MHNHMRYLESCLSCFVLSVVLTFTGSASAANNNSQDPLKVTGVESNRGPRIALNDTLKVRVENLDKWVDQAGHDYSKFVLYVDGNAIPDLPLGLVANDKKLQFDLNRTLENKDAWDAVLSRRQGIGDRSVSITLRQGGVKVQGYATANLIFIKEGWFYWFLCVLAVATILCLWLANNTDIIRDAGEQPNDKNESDDCDKQSSKSKPYSLARTQLASWSFVVFFSFVFIWMVTGDLASLTTSVLTLIGISAATGLGSAIVDDTNRSPQVAKIETLKKRRKDDQVALERNNDEKNKLSEVNDRTTGQNRRLEECGATQEEKQKAIDEADERIRELESKEIKPPSKDFITDILKDNAGVSLHRFQIVVWTLLLMLIFIHAVWNDLAMPDFDATLLALMGISSATYIGFKLPNQRG